MHGPLYSSFNERISKATLFLPYKRIYLYAYITLCNCNVTNSRMAWPISWNVNCMPSCSVAAVLALATSNNQPGPTHCEKRHEKLQMYSHSQIEQLLALFSPKSFPSDSAPRSAKQAQRAGLDTPLLGRMRLTWAMAAEGHSQVMSGTRTKVFHPFSKTS